MVVMLGMGLTLTFGSITKVGGRCVPALTLPSLFRCSGVAPVLPLGALVTARPRKHDASMAVMVLTGEG